MQKQVINNVAIIKSFDEPKGYFGYLGYALEKFEETEYIYRESDEW